MGTGGIAAVNTLFSPFMLSLYFFIYWFIGLLTDGSGSMVAGFFVVPAITYDAFVRVASSIYN